MRWVCISLLVWRLRCTIATWCVLGYRWWQCSVWSYYSWLSICTELSQSSRQGRVQNSLKVLRHSVVVLCVILWALDTVLESRCCRLVVLKWCNVLKLLCSGLVLQESGCLKLKPQSLLSLKTVSYFHSSYYYWYYFHTSSMQSELSDLV